MYIFKKIIATQGYLETEGIWEAEVRPEGSRQNSRRRASASEALVLVCHDFACAIGL